MIKGYRAQSRRSAMIEIEEGSGNVYAVLQTHDAGAMYVKARLASKIGDIIRHRHLTQQQGYLLCNVVLRSIGKNVVQVIGIQHVQRPGFKLVGRGLFEPLPDMWWQRAKLALQQSLHNCAGTFESSFF